MPNITVDAAAHPIHKDITIISIKGFIDTTTAPEFEKVFQTVLAEKQFNLIINLKDVNYVSSAGWGIFVGEIKRIRSQKGNLFLVAMNPEVAEVFELLEFDSILKSFPDPEQAILKGFMRTKAARAPAKAASAKGPAASPVQPAVESPAMNITFAETGADKGPKKAGWLGRILLPWKWF